MIEPTQTFLERVNMLEGFKHLDISYFVLEFESTEELYKLAQHGYVTVDPDFVNSDTDDDNNDYMSIEEPNKYGPIEGVYLNALEAEQVNFAHAIINADIDWLKRNTFNPETIATRWLHYNYALFKHVFVWVLPHFPTNDAKFHAALCQLLGQTHTINDMFYHWSWYVFPRIMEHYTEVHESIDFLIEAVTTINSEEHTWQGEVDDVATISLGRRPRPIFQLFWRYAVFYDYQEAAFVKLFERMKQRNDVDYMKKLWRCLKKELAESRASALWEEPGRSFRLAPGPIAYRTVSNNLPLHVFYNGNQIRFTPYIVRACRDVFGSIPEVLYQIVELQCYYVTRHSRTTQLVYELMRERYGSDDEEYAEKISFLQKLERTAKRVHW